MKQKINRILGYKFRKQYNVKLLSILEEDNETSMLISYNETESMFKISNSIDLKEGIEAIKSIIKNEVEFK